MKILKLVTECRILQCFQFFLIIFYRSIIFKWEVEGVHSYWSVSSKLWRYDDRLWVGAVGEGGQSL